VARGEADAGIVIDGAGLGSTIAANKVAGARAAMCLNETLARYAREHNGANVLALGSSLITTELAFEHCRDIPRYADARRALHPAAGQDP
jgi:ribose 5-phosphate isomerase B